MQQIVLITGASRGIGAAIARAMAREGATVVLASRKQPGLDEVRVLALALRPRLHCFGHVHHTPGILRRADLGRTIFCNAASCNWFWCAVRRPVVCDLPLTALETRILHAGRGYV